MLFMTILRSSQILGIVISFDIYLKIQYHTLISNKYRCLSYQLLKQYIDVYNDESQFLIIYFNVVWHRLLFVKIIKQTEEMVKMVKSSLELMLYCFIMCRIQIKFSYLILSYVIVSTINMYTDMCTGFNSWQRN